MLQREDDLLTGRSRVYVYNTAGQVKEIGEFDTADKLYDRDTLVLYDTDGKVSALTDTIDYLANGAINKVEVSNHYSYTNDGRLTSSYISSGIRLNVTYEYDLLNRVSETEYKSNTSNGFENLNEYTYINSSYDSVSTSGQVTGHVSSVFKGSSRVSLNNYSYEYDDRGNITHITQNGYNVYYHYDDLGQLVREDNELLGKTYVLYYDDAGNIEAKLIYQYSPNELPESHDTNIYHYDNSAWGDQLTMFDDDITYDAIGNPINYYNGFTFGWSGRQLITATKGSNSYTFVYNSDGIRAEKTVNGVAHKYYYSGTQLLAEEWGNNLIIFLYDANGLPVGMKYRTTSYASSTFDTYWYERNLQGDIVAIFGDDSTKYATYRYDAWGNHTVTYYNGGGSIVPVMNNPLRYRGYYYDVDLGLYYLQTRYYDSNTGRFISPDAPENLGVDQTLVSYNLYAYCSNNPVMHTDPSGESWLVIAALLLLFTPVGGTALQVAASAISYAGIAVASVFDTDIKNDMSAIGWNPFNTDESISLNSNKVSFYKGVPVFRTASGGRSGSFGAIFLTKGSGIDTLMHERGHNWQLMTMGIANYGLMIGLPSWQEWSSRPYYERPWEITADVFGCVSGRSHSQGNINRGYWYLGVSSLLCPVGYLFLFGEY